MRLLISVLPAAATVDEPVLSEPLAPVVEVEPLVAPIVLLLLAEFWSELLLAVLRGSPAIELPVEPEVEPLVVAEPLRLPEADRSVDAVELVLG